MIKLSFTRDEILLLGQLGTELQQRIAFDLTIQAVIFWEFYKENASLFLTPEPAKRKVRFSVYLGLLAYLFNEQPRNDIWWDMTLKGLIDKLNRMRFEGGIRTKLLG